MLDQLHPIGGGDPIPVFYTRLRLGRSKSCDISLRYPSVAPLVCELRLIDGYWTVWDAAHKRRKVGMVLLPGDILKIGQHKYKIEHDPQSHPGVTNRDS
jgi:hypothetical protein